MATYFNKEPFDGFEYDTQTKKERTLQCLEGLKPDCASVYDLARLRDCITILKNLDLRTYA